MFSLDDRLVTNRYSPTTSVGLFLAMCDPELGALDWTYTGVHASSYPLPMDLLDWRLLNAILLATGPACR